jgi:hypothetical protein
MGTKKVNKMGDCGIANASHCHPNKFALPSLGLPTHFVRRHPRMFELPKALQTTNFVCCLAFFVLVSLHKQACDAALNEKSLSTLLRGFVARSGFEPETSGL